MVEPTVKELIKQAQYALFSGNRTEARRLAIRAIQLEPDSEEAWLILAALGSSRGSLSYLKEVLEINPGNQLAREAMHWAVRRHREDRQPVHKTQIEDTKENKPYYRAAYIQERTETYTNNPSDSLAIKLKSSQLIRTFSVLLITTCIFGLGFLLWFAFSNDYIALARAPAAARPTGVLIKPSLTPTRTFTPTSTYTVTPSPTLTPSPTPTNTPTATFTNTIEATFTAIPSEIIPPNDPVEIPSEISADEHWIDVDVSEQRLSAFQGNELIRSFAISSGMWYSPTPLGQYHIYVKYVSADMKGPGYYLPAVPHVMYFDGDYGIHGAYWHMNFGTPMSHGCVNMSLEDAEWLFDFASIGTLVNIHN